MAMADKKSSERREVPTEEPTRQSIPLTDNVKATDKDVGITEKDLSRTDMEGAEESGMEVFGDPGAWKCLCKASNAKEGWMKSTKVMQVGSAGCLIQVTTQQKNPDGSYTLAEAVCFAERVNLVDEAGVVSLM
jgi:hypothetical protein